MMGHVRNLSIISAATRRRRNEHLPSFIFCLFVEKYLQYYYYTAGNLFLLLRAFVS